MGVKRTSRHATLRGLHQKHGHVSRMACITPVCALALHFSRCWFAHSRKASTIASCDTNDFGHAEGIDIVIKSGGSLMCFNASPFIKAWRATLETNSKQKTSSTPALCCTVCIDREHATQCSQILQMLELGQLLRERPRPLALREVISRSLLPCLSQHGANVACRILQHGCDSSLAGPVSAFRKRPQSITR